MHIREEQHNIYKVSISSQGQQYQYTIKVIDPGRKSEYDVKEVVQNKKFTTVDQIKETISKTLDFEVGDIGYISPGHGMKGKKCPLLGDHDIEAMCCWYKGKHNILLWCYLSFHNLCNAGKKGKSARIRLYP